MKVRKEWGEGRVCIRWRKNGSEKKAGKGKVRKREEELK
jgi:hypothetical protein